MFQLATTADAVDQYVHGAVRPDDPAAAALPLTADPGLRWARLALLHHRKRRHLLDAVFGKPRPVSTRTGSRRPDLLDWDHRATARNVASHHPQ